MKPQHPLDPLTFAQISMCLRPLFQVRHRYRPAQDMFVPEKLAHSQGECSEK